MKVIWTPQGFTLLLEIVKYLSEFIGNDKANEFQIELIQFANDKLSQFPERNPPCRYEKLQAAGYRCLTFKKKYVIIFRENNNQINIIGVISSKRNPQFFNDLLS